MNEQELNILLKRLGLHVPKNEQGDLLAASLFIEKMSASVKKPFLDTTEPAHVVLFPVNEEKDSK